MPFAGKVFFVWKVRVFFRPLLSAEDSIKYVYNVMTLRKSSTSVNEVLGLAKEKRKRKKKTGLNNKECLC